MLVPLKKFVLLIMSTSLLSGCGGVSSLVSSSKSDSSFSYESSSASESNIATSTSESSQTIQSSVNYNPLNCQNHQLNETISKEATLIEKGIKHYYCPNCQAEFADFYYKMDEFAFKDVTYMDDGNEHQIMIEGVLPYGVTVQYENNTLKGKGEKEATAKFYDENKQLLLEKKAKINIVDNIGFPNIRIVTEDGDDPDYHTQSDGKRPYKNMTLSIDNCAQTYVRNNLAGEIKVRGNSTNQANVGKRAFRIKLGSKNNLLGLNHGAKEKSWVLLADFFDQSNFRNLVAYSMGNDLFNYSGYYTSTYQHVILYMNNENRGVYLLAEQQQAKQSRIPIMEPEEDVTTNDVGYLIELDGLTGQNGKMDKTTGLGSFEGDVYFKADSAGRVNNVSISEKPYVIKTDTWSDEQRQFIKKYTSNATKAFANTCNNNLQVVSRVEEDGVLKDSELKASTFTSQYETLNQFLDLDSFFRMYVLQEFMKNFDVGWGSFYLYVDFSKNSKAPRLTMGAPWDFDLGEGDKQSGGGWGMWGGGSSSNDNEIPTSGIASTQDNFLSSTEYTNGMTTFNPWLYMLSQTDFFKTMFKKYYSIFMNSSIYEKMIHHIEYERVAFKDVFDDNHTRYVTNIDQSAFSMQTRRYETFDKAVDYLLKWFKERKSYLDNTWGK